MRNCLLLCAAALLGSATAFAAEVEVKWQDPEKFTDIRPVNESRTGYRERLMKQFDGFFQQLGAELPEGYKWEVTVLDVDLAGDVDYFARGAGDAVRVVKDVFSPAIKFNHVLSDKYGEQIIGGEEKLRDMGFLYSLQPLTNRGEFYYEKEMLEDWFKKVVKPQLEQHAKALPKTSDNL